MADEKATFKVRESASYGRACNGCYKAKCKCILRGPGLQCERCQRLKQECEPSTVARKRLSRKTAYRTAHLEERLDDLVGLLKSQASGAYNASPNSAPSAHPTFATQPAENWAGEKGSKNKPLAPRASQNLLPAQRPSWNTDPLSQIEPSASQAEQYLAIFQQQHLNNFPFYCISSTTTPAQLQRERPLLWLCIWANGCKSVVQQRVIEVKIRENLARKVLVDLERNLDLLLGLIAYLSWASDKYSGKSLLAVFANIAMSLLSDLKLDRSFREFPCRELDVTKAYSHPIKEKVQLHHRTNEERRAVLGCYIICTTIAWFLNNRPVQWTVHMEGCLQDLSEHPEVPGDRVLVVLTQLLKLTSNLHEVSTWRHIEDPSPQTKPHRSLHVKSLRAVLDKIKSSAPPEILGNKIVLSYVYFTEALINELPLYPLEASQQIGCFDFGRTECFFACLQAMKNCMENFVTFAPEAVHSHPMMLHLHFSRCTHILYRLSLMEDPSWNRGDIPHVIDVLRSIEQCASLYESVSSAIGMETDGSDMYTQAAEILRATKALWRRKFEEAGVILPTTKDQHSNNSTLQADEGIFDLPADGWFADIFHWGEPFSIDT
ncbi:hypothetical protein PENCOP_c003G00796 [Penicillium coprophilum]|uniref:Zn(2)-C6 fungal-type domain-containing protein n=1 Tax=Penicillium coprophilum TaxID=36646 RepID=A0A1V6UYR6_9EURO|nr:hypothetical protein PENCOP_c003G00796 [Penicillium coprophilum]